MRPRSVTARTAADSWDGAAMMPPNWGVTSICVAGPLASPPPANTPPPSVLPVNRPPLTPPKEGAVTRGALLASNEPPPNAGPLARVAPLMLMHR